MSATDRIYEFIIKMKGECGEENPVKSVTVSRRMWKQLEYEMIKMRYTGMVYLELTSSTMKIAGVEILKGDK